MNKILTISIAAYNVGQYIEKAIYSCLNNKIAKDIEILVIDDGSHDNTLEIVEKLHEQYPETIRIISKQNGGYGSTINLSVKMAKGIYFKLLDGDDWFDTVGLESHLNDLKLHDVDMALTPNVKCFENGNEKQIRDNAPDMDSGEYAIEDVNIPGNINMHSVTYKTQLLRDNEIKITEHCFYTDAEFVVFPLQYVKRIYISHVPVYCYRIGNTEQSMARAGIRKHFRDHTKVLKHIFRLYNQIKDKGTRATEWIYYRLVTEISNHYHYLCMLNLKMINWKLLKNFDAKVKANKKIYEDTAEYSKFVKALRKTHFFLYPICYLWEERQF